MPHSCNICKGQGRVYSKIKSECNSCKSDLKLKTFCPNCLGSNFITKLYSEICWSCKGRCLN